MRNNVITVLADDYVRMARAKGLRPWRIMWKYAGKNAILPNLTGLRDVARPRGVGGHPGRVRVRLPGRGHSPADRR